MIKFIPFKLCHVDGARAHPSQAQFQHFFDRPDDLEIKLTSSAFDGDVLVAIGALTLLEGATGGWVLFTNQVTPTRFLAIHRFVERELLWFETKGEPIIFHVDPERPDTVRWAELLGRKTHGFDRFPDGRFMMRVGNNVP